MAAEGLFAQKLFIENKPYFFVFVVHKPKQAGGTAFNSQKGSELLLRGKTETGAAKLSGEILGFERLISGHYQKIKVRLLTVCKKKIFCNGAAENGLCGAKVFHSHCRIVVNALKGDGEIFEKIIASLFCGNSAAFFGATGEKSRLIHLFVFPFFQHCRRRL